MQSLQAKIQNADQQLAGIREQLRRAPPAQQAIIKQQAAGILRNRAMWMKQAQTTSAKVANLDQSEWLYARRALSQAPSSLEAFIIFPSLFSLLSRCILFIFLLSFLFNFLPKFFLAPNTVQTHTRTHVYTHLHICIYMCILSLLTQCLLC